MQCTIYFEASTVATPGVISDVALWSNFVMTFTNDLEIGVLPTDCKRIRPIILRFKIIYIRIYYIYIGGRNILIRCPTQACVCNIGILHSRSTPHNNTEKREARYRDEREIGYFWLFKLPPQNCSNDALCIFSGAR